MSRMPRARRIRRLALGAALAAVAVGSRACCGARGAASRRRCPTGSPPSIQQGRLDVEARRLVVRVENAGDAAVDDRPASSVDGADAREPASCATSRSSSPPGEALAIRLDLPASRVRRAAGDGGARASTCATVRRRTVDGRRSSPTTRSARLARVGDADCLADVGRRRRRDHPARAPALDGQRRRRGARSSTSLRRRPRHRATRRS